MDGVNNRLLGNMDISPYSIYFEFLGHGKQFIIKRMFVEIILREGVFKVVFVICRAILFYIAGWAWSLNVKLRTHNLKFPL
jgi:hypothetical protein